MDRFSALVFDLDGTLANSHNLIVEMVNRVLVKRAYPLAEARQIHAMTGLPLDHIFRTVLPAAAAEEAESCIEDYRALFDAHAIPAMRPIEGAVEAVERIERANQWPLGVATGRLTSTALVMLERFGLTGHFRVILGADAVSRPKPYPDLLLRVLDDLGGIDPAEVLVIGDSSADVGMAHAAGAAACAVTWGAQTRGELLDSEPRWCIDRWGELLEILGLEV